MLNPDEAFQQSVKLKCSLGSGTCVGAPMDNSEEETEAGYILVQHPDFIVPLCCILSKEMLDLLVTQLQEIRDQVTYSSPVFTMGDNDNVH